jgi:calcineurin-like phosphoesterase family protein
VVALEPGAYLAKAVVRERLSTVRVHMDVVAGNHGLVSPMFLNAERHFGDYAAVFESVQQHARTKVGGADMMLSRFPYLAHRIASRANSSTNTSSRTSANG